jgi:phenylalanyl-tRNA synthetase alpha subunit
VYRRDEIDSTHYPVFHQIEGVRLVGKSEFTKINGNRIQEDLFKGFEGTNNKI